MWLLLHTIVLSRLLRGNLKLNIVVNQGLCWRHLSRFCLIINFELISRDDCVCPGSTIVYECNVTRRGTTVYKGSAFNCQSSNDELLLLPLNQSTNKTCNNGAIVARTNSNTQSSLSFSSTLTVTLNHNVMPMKEIKCSIDDGLTVLVIGSYYIPRFNTGICQEYQHNSCIYIIFLLQNLPLPQQT